MNLPRLFARGTSATGTTSQSRPRWHYLYYLLAAFDICAVCASLYLNQQMMRIYIDSVATDRTWVEIGHAAAQLGEAAASIDAPGNDVFRTRDFAGERENLRRAQDEFNAQVVRLRRMLSAEEQDETVRGLLEDVKTSGDTTAQMVRSAVLTFAYLADNQLEQATTHMATMDRFYASVHSTLVRMRSRISDLQEAQFSKQVAAAASLQKAEYLIVGMISLMVFGATAYGRLIARQVSVEANLKEAYRAELEQRIKERTADLTAVNEVRAQLLKSLLSAQEAVSYTHLTLPTIA